MFCSRSIGVHLLKGLGALILTACALYLGARQAPAVFLAPALLFAAFLLLRGCPMCWLMGLIDTIANRETRAPQVKRPADG